MQTLILHADSEASNSSRESFLIPIFGIAFSVSLDDARSGVLDNLLEDLTHLRGFFFEALALSAVLATEDCAGEDLVLSDGLAVNRAVVVEGVEEIVLEALCFVSI